ncbi:MAG: ACT domain-containing protein [Actinomycetales bacterium]|nr:ACT domain-containing protein [Actinomycetales bacterium]
MSGITDLATLLASLDPVRRDGEWVYVDTLPAGVVAEASVREAEGGSFVVARADADARGLRYDFVAAWIELRVHSALEAVGMTAAFATALGRAGIPANVIAGLRHDHVLVPADRADDALAALRGLAGEQDG